MNLTAMNKAKVQMRTLMGALLLVSLLTWPLIALAQTLTTDAPVEQKLWEVMLKMLFPTVWIAVAPFFTKFVTAGLLKVVTVVPPSLKIVISSVVAALIAAVAGAIPDFPLTIESAVEMAAPQGASAQMLANMHPATVQPKAAQKG